MTLQDLILRVKELLPTEILPYVSDAAIIRHLNMGYEKVAGLTLAIRVGYSAPVVNEEVRFPPYVLAVCTARWTDGTTTADLKVMYWSEAVNILSGSAIYNPPAGTPKFLIVFSPTKVNLYPKPPTGGTVEGIAAVTPHPNGTVLPLQNPGDEPKFFSPHHDALAFYAAANILLPYGQYGNLVEGYSTIFYDKINKIREAADDFTMKPAQLYPPVMTTAGVIIGYVP